jgi:hypothetical protein
VYTVPFQVSATSTVQAIAVASGYSNSAIAAGTYFLSQGQNQSQTITFPAIPTQTYLAGPIALAATASSGLAVSYAIVSGPATVSGGLLTINGVGSVTVQASQAGNGQYAAAAPVSQTFTVTQASTMLVLTSNSNPSARGQSVTFAATIMPQNGGQATGTITFKEGTTVLGTVAVSENLATLTTSALAMGTNHINAVYSGDGNFIGSTSATLSQVVTTAATTTTLSSSINPSYSGQKVTFTIAVSSPGVGPTGSVELLNGTNVLAKLTLQSGAAKYNVSTLATGSNSMTAVYLGDANNNGSTSAPVNQFVKATTTTTLTPSPAPSFYGETVLLTATVTSSLGAPPNGETVTFYQGTTTLGTGSLSAGTATLSVSTLGVGNKPLTAAYGGDTNFVTSTSKVITQVIGKASTTVTLTSAQNPSTSKQPVTFTATIVPEFAGTPTGTATFYDGSKSLGTAALSGGVAKFTTSTLASGTHTITATYSGNTSFTGSAGSLTQTVN